MLPTFIIGLREGVEAALIVGIIAAFLVQEGRRDGLRWMWAGVGAALAICAVVALALQALNSELPQREQEGLETIVGLLAVAMVTFMIVWMRRHARGLAGELRTSAASALAEGSMIALVGMAFFAVIREGFETAVFMLAAFQSSTSPTSAGIGAVLGVAVACLIGWGIYTGGVRLNLSRFFKFTGFVLVLVAAGLFAGAMHTAHEAGWLTVGQDQALDLSWLVVPGTWTASLLTGMLGLQPRPTVIEAGAYLLYAIPMGLFVLWPQRRPKASAIRAVAGASLTLVALTLVACGDSSSSAEGTRSVKVALTDAGCSPSSIKIEPGPTTFTVSNSGTTKVSEFEILDGSRIIGEKENVIEGLDGDFTLNMKPGNYTIACPGGSSAASGDLVVSGAAAAQAGDAQLKAATAGYTSYVETQAKELQRRVRAFTAAVKSGDTAKAKSLFASARAPYETIEPVAESFGNLDPEIDARVNDVAKGDPWTGFHRIEQGLWQKNSTAGLSTYADKLMADVNRLAKKVKGLGYEPEELANGANGLLGEVSASKITGEEDRYSHTDLSDFEANVLGSQAAFGLLAPALRKRDPQLAPTISTRFKATLAALEPYRRGDGFVSYDTVGQAERRRLSQSVDALAEPLSKVAAQLQT